MGPRGPGCGVPARREASRVQVPDRHGDAVAQVCWRANEATGGPREQNGGAKTGKQRRKHGSCRRLLTGASQPGGPRFTPKRGCPTGSGGYNAVATRVNAFAYPPACHQGVKQERGGVFGQRESRVRSPALYRQEVLNQLHEQLSHATTPCRGPLVGLRRGG